MIKSKTLVIHPFLVAAYPVFWLSSCNLGKVGFLDTVVPLVTLEGAAVISMAIFCKYFKDFEKAGILTSVVAFLFMHYGFFSVWAEQTFLGGVFHSYVSGYLASTALFFMAPISVVAWLLFKNPVNKNLTRMLNVITILLCAIALGIIANYSIHINWKNLKSSQESMRPESEQRDGLIVNGAADEDLPDIYYIIVDGYARSDVIKSHFGFDNTNFEMNMRRKGFYVATESQSNYSFTLDSLASSLNMRYGVRNDWVAMRSWIRNNRVVETLRKRGYKYVVLPAGGVFEPMINIPQADMQFLASSGNELTDLLIQNSVLQPFLPALISQSRTQGILYSLQRLRMAPSIPGPKFVFAHLMVPHTPYFFERNGAPISFLKMCRPLTPNQKKKRFADQIMFINSQLEQIADDIINKSERPPIIVIQGDHGTFPTWRGERMPVFDFFKKEEVRDLVRERLGIISMYYFPHGGDKELYSSITPVNTFRLIFRYYLKLPKKILKDKCYFKNGENFFDVTSMLKKDSN